MPIKIALPKGRLLDETAALLQESGWGLTDYHRQMRLYRLESQCFPDITAKVFQERDIPIQVAAGNYDLGICSLDWIEELSVKYSRRALVKVENLGYGEGILYVVASRSGGVSTIEEIQARPGTIRIASEYPNLAESLALNLRLKRFSIFPLWGAAEAYPPESADLALIPGDIEVKTFNHALVPLSKVLSFSAFLISNKSSWETKDLSEVVASIRNKPMVGKKHLPSANIPGVSDTTEQLPAEKTAEDIVRLALPDGHQQTPTIQLLNRAGIQVDDYPSAEGNRRPTINLAGVMVKVIRPQDMPLQVANGNFDLAITGRDWLSEHLCQFPSSPVTERLDLKFGKVKIVAVVSQDLPADDVHSLRQLSSKRLSSLRVASEYINIADEYARDNHLGMYRVIPTWGASEAFLPEDADLLIENTETGGTIARHNLKIIDTLFESTACLIIHKDSLSSPGKSKNIKSLTETLSATVEDG